MLGWKIKIAHLQHLQLAKDFSSKDVASRREQIQNGVYGSQDQIKDAMLRHAAKTSERFQSSSQLYKSSNNLKVMP